MLALLVNMDGLIAPWPTLGKKLRALDTRRAAFAKEGFLEESESGISSNWARYAFSDVISSSLALSVS